MFLFENGCKFKSLIKINYKLYIFNENYVGIFIINPNCFKI